MPKPSAIDDARATMMNGVAIMTQDTTPRSTEHNASRITTPATPIRTFAAAVRNRPKDKSNPTCTVM